MRLHVDDHLRVTDLHEILHVPMRPEGRAAVEARLVAARILHRRLAHRHHQRHEDRLGRVGRAKPDRARRRALARGCGRLRLHDPRHVRAIDGDGALPRAHARVARHAQLGVTVGRAKRPGGGADAGVVQRALVVRAVGGEGVAHAEQLVGLDGERVERRAPWVAWRGDVVLEAVVHRRQRERRLEAAEAIPHAPPGVVLVGVLAEREGAREVETAGAVPQPVRQCGRVQVRRADEALRIVQVDLADREHVGDDGDLVVRHALRRPQRARPARVGEDVEDPRLVGVAHHQHLAGAAVGPVEAVLLGEAAHEHDRLASAARALGRNLGELVDAQQRGAAVGADGVGAEDRGRRRLAERQLALVLDRVVVLKVAVRVRRLRDVADRRGELLAWERRIRLAACVADVARVRLGARPDRAQRALGMVSRGHEGDPRV